MKKSLIFKMIVSFVVGCSLCGAPKAFPAVIQEIKTNQETKINKEQQLQQTVPQEPSPQQSAPQQQGTEPHRIYIPIIAKGIKAEFWNPVREGAEKAAQDYGITITLQGPGEERQTEEQLRYLREALAKHPEAIVFSAVDAKAATPYLEQAQASRIPVIGFDSGVNSPIVKTTVGIDNYGAGALAANKMAALLGQRGKVALIVQDDTSKVATGRRDGFVDTIEQQYPNMQVIGIGYGEGDPQKSAEIAKRFVEENPGIKGIFGGNEGSAEGVISAIRELGKAGEITAIGFDSGREIIDAVSEGLLAGAITQKPRDMGYKAVETALRAYEGAELPQFIDTGFEWYDKTNIDNPEIKQLLYE